MAGSALIGGIARLREELGAIEFASLALIIAGAVFLILVLKPLQETSRALDREIERVARRDLGPGAHGTPAATAAARLESFYGFLDHARTRTDWLAKLHSISRSTGLDLRSAEYRLTNTGQRLVRYQIRAPLSGSYANVRRFLERALTEIPVLSLDQVSFRRKHAADRQIETEVVMTLHLLRS